MIVNHEELIKETSYYDTEASGDGLLLFSVNGSCLHLLLPGNVRDEILPEVRTGKEVIITKGLVKDPKDDGLKPGIEVVFEDHTDYPFTITISLDQGDLTPEDDDRWMAVLSMDKTRTGLHLRSVHCMLR